ncbi:hypothetical protein Taro_018366 [Colocasia esculenta]|uniref:tRNA(Phe) (4-demethylwyosine(37)-C(7)) aminocarboxypropyltransferase n=1 Tax=Colocasia esculenta TaxID=4460 RepID=A0A843V288_COLES|nr:hypothetical protein [Colocasia esculenta]
MMRFLGDRDRECSLPINVNDDKDDDDDDDDPDPKFTAGTCAGRHTYAEEEDRRRGMGTLGSHLPRDDYRRSLLRSTSVRRAATALGCGDYLFILMVDVVEEVGEENVVQVVTDNKASYKDMKIIQYHPINKKEAKGKHKNNMEDMKDNKGKLGMIRDMDTLRMGRMPRFDPTRIGIGGVRSSTPIRSLHPCLALMILCVADRVCLGLLPSSEGSWLTAVRALRPEGGVLHIHGNVKDSEEKMWTEYVVTSIDNMAKLEGHPWDVSLQHLERVKWYGPHIRHLVADIKCKAL